jgi:hypothetical protein
VLHRPRLACGQARVNLDRLETRSRRGRLVDTRLDTGPGLVVDSTCPR